MRVWTATVCVCTLYVYLCTYTEGNIYTVYKNTQISHWWVFEENLDISWLFIVHLISISVKIKISELKLSCFFIFKSTAIFTWVLWNLHACLSLNIVVYTANTRLMPILTFFQKRTFPVFSSERSFIVYLNKKNNQTSECVFKTNKQTRIKFKVAHF